MQLDYSGEYRSVDDTARGERHDYLDPSFMADLFTRGRLPTRVDCWQG